MAKLCWARRRVYLHQAWHADPDSFRCLLARDLFPGRLWRETLTSFPEKRRAQTRPFRSRPQRSCGSSWAGLRNLFGAVMAKWARGFGQLRPSHWRSSPRFTQSASHLCRCTPTPSRPFSIASCIVVLPDAAALCVCIPALLLERAECQGPAQVQQVSSAVRGRAAHRPAYPSPFRLGQGEDVAALEGCSYKTLPWKLPGQEEVGTHFLQTILRALTRQVVSMHAP